MVRLLAAIPTPFGPVGDPDLDAFAAHLEWLLERGLDGVFVGGTTGEGVLLEPDEVVALVERAVAVAGGERVIAQVGRPSTRATVALLERAYAAGAGQAAAYVPWFYPASDDQVRRHFLALLRPRADGRDLLAYTIPRMHVNVLAPDVLGELAAAGLGGMKDSTGDPDCHRAFVAAVAGPAVPHLHRQRPARARARSAPAGSARSRRSPPPARTCSRRSAARSTPATTTPPTAPRPRWPPRRTRWPARARRSPRSSGGCARRSPSAASTTRRAPRAPFD